MKKKNRVDFWAGSFSGIILRIRILSFVIRDVLFARMGIPVVPQERITRIQPSVVSLMSLAIERVCGPAKIRCASDEFVVVCPVRDGMEYLPYFIEYYRNLRAKHLVFLDTGSRDKTLPFLMAQSGVTVYQTRLPFKTYTGLFKSFLRKRFGAGQWCLCVDVDEFFDYPGSRRIAMKEFLSFLNDHGFNAVLAHMLEMFADKPLRECRPPAGADFREYYRFYDLTDIREEPLCGVGETEKKHFRNFRGGIRARVFGLDPRDSHTLLTKTPLARFGPEFRFFDAGAHGVNRHAKIADVTAVLYHYPFTASLREKSCRAVREKQYWLDSSKYKKYLEVLGREPGLNLYEKAWAPREFAGTDPLVEEGFLRVSENYRRMVSVDFSGGNDILPISARRLKETGRHE